MIFLAAILIERIVLKITGRGRARASDQVTNLVMATVARIPIILKLLFIKTYFYPFLYQYRVIEWEYYSWQHWIFTAIAVDFFYYWAHRCFHECNIGWAGKILKFKKITQTII